VRGTTKHHGRASCQLRKQLRFRLLTAGLPALVLYLPP